MSRWQEDEVDRACNAWAYQWVRNFANAPQTAGAAIGPLGCTLGRVRELHDAAASTGGRRDEHWPEVFMGEGLLVAIALNAMHELTRQVIHRHYIERWFAPVPGKGGLVTLERRSRPTKQAVIAARMGVSLARYYTLRDCAKQCVSVVLTLDSKGLASRGGTGVQAAQRRDSLSHA